MKARKIQAFLSGGSRSIPGHAPTRFLTQSGRAKSKSMNGGGTRSLIELVFFHETMIKETNLEVISAVTVLRSAGTDSKHERKITNLSWVSANLTLAMTKNKGESGRWPCAVAVWALMGKGTE
jgi:hypothetical protein